MTIEHMNTRVFMVKAHLNSIFMLIVCFGNCSIISITAGSIVASRMKALPGELHKRCLITVCGELPILAGDRQGNVIGFTAGTEVVHLSSALLTGKGFQQWGRKTGKIDTNSIYKNVFQKRNASFKRINFDWEMKQL